MVVMLMHGQTNSQNKPERASYCFFISWTSRLSSIKVFDNVADCPRARKFSAPDKCARGQQFGCYPNKGTNQASHSLERSHWPTKSTSWRGCEGFLHFKDCSCAFFRTRHSQTKFVPKSIEIQRSYGHAPTNRYHCLPRRWIRVRLVPERFVPCTYLGIA